MATGGRHLSPAPSQPSFELSDSVSQQLFVSTWVGNFSTYTPFLPNYFYSYYSITSSFLRFYQFKSNTHLF